MKDETPVTNIGEKWTIVCRNLIRSREMKNADTFRDYCFFMHHDTAAAIYLERLPHERVSEIDKLYGIPVRLDSKMEYGEISLVLKGD